MELQQRNYILAKSTVCYKTQLGSRYAFQTFRRCLLQVPFTRKLKIWTALLTQTSNRNDPYK
jgi:hypothetical protein